MQSFDDGCLQALGRIHDATQAKLAIGKAQTLGFKRINLDLMHGLPGQSVESGLSDLQQALEFGTDHLSWYQLTIEPNTEFHSRPLTYLMKTFWLIFKIKAKYLSKRLG